MGGWIDPWRERFLESGDRRRRAAPLLLAVALLAGLTAIHLFLPFGPGFRALYILPVWLATRIGGRKAGFVLVVLATLVGGVVDQAWGHVGPEVLFANLVIGFLALGTIMLVIAQVEQSLQNQQRLALTDPLTGLLNRRALGEFADLACRQAFASQSPVTTVILDCDGFKGLNDEFGHQAGDHVLVLLARALEAHTRRTDLVARIGGDEFAILFPGTSIEEAQTIMHRVDEAFGRLAHDEGYATGLSLGFSSSEQGARDWRALLQQADRAMYDGKRAKKSAFLN